MEKKKEKWIGQLRRESKDKTIWKPCDSNRVCSDHFVDGEVTVTHPFPELKLGYEKQILQPRRKIFKYPVPLKKAKKDIPAETVQISSPFRTPQLEHQEQHPEFPMKHQFTVCCQVVKSVVVVFVRTY